MNSSHSSLPGFRTNTDWVIEVRVGGMKIKRPFFFFLPDKAVGRNIILIFSKKKDINTELQIEFTHSSQAELGTLPVLSSKVPPPNLEHLSTEYQRTM